MVTDPRSARQAERGSAPAESSGTSLASGPLDAAVEGPDAPLGGKIRHTVGERHVGICATMGNAQPDGADKAASWISTLRAVRSDGPDRYRRGLPRESGSHPKLASAHTPYLAPAAKMRAAIGLVLMGASAA
jgi:hypothetical protein